jgi:plastocyanin
VSPKPILLLVLLTTLSGHLGCSALVSEAPRPPETGDVHGRLLPGGPDHELAEGDRVVVYLDRLDQEMPVPVPNQEAEVRLHKNEFSPSFLVTGIDQLVRFPNEDEIYHRIFSYSERNAFDLGVMQGGDSKGITFEHPGVVRFYCSLHPSEGGTIFVAPSRHFDTVQAPRTYEIRDVRPGRYRLRTWGEAIPHWAKIVTVRGGVSTLVEIPIEGQTEPR